MQRLEHAFLREARIAPIVDQHDIGRCARGEIGAETRAIIGLTGDVHEIDLDVRVLLFKSGDQRLIGFEFFGIAEDHK